MGIGDRISNRVQALFRSWYFFIGFLVWTAVWWLLLGPHMFDDKYPWVAWTTITTLVTQVDVLIVGIGQKKQQERQDNTLRALLTLAEADQARTQAILAIGDAQQALLKSNKTELEELHGLLEDSIADKTP